VKALDDCSSDARDLEQLLVGRIEGRFYAAEALDEFAGGRAADASQCTLLILSFHASE